MNEGDEYLGFPGVDRAATWRKRSPIANQKLIELQVEKAQYEAQLKVINEQLNEQQKFFQNLPDNMIRLARLKREVKINEKLYLTVSQQFAEMSSRKETQFGLGRPVDQGYI
ncbi:MAG: hypothetical protein U5J63_08150 [Fodinibius sp.]|nr:hypothetical protein [Fodinibius sp.]